MGGFSYHSSKSDSALWAKDISECLTFGEVKFACLQSPILEHTWKKNFKLQKTMSDDFWISELHTNVK